MVVNIVLNVGKQTIRLPDDLKKYADAKAKKDGISFNIYIRTLVYNERKKDEIGTS